MRICKKLSFAFLLIFLLNSTNLHAATAKRLDVYIIDVEGGAATLIITPQGESVLVDSGFPGDRDPERIAHVAKDVAGLARIDHYVTTHWHRDHVGGIARLAQLIPVVHYYDHGLPTAPADDIQQEYIAAYRKTAQDRSITLRPGDFINVKPNKQTPLHFRILTGEGLVVGEKPGAAQIQPCGPNFQSIPEDKTDNNKSLSLLLTFGRFELFNGGDITWNIENRLVCPKNLVGEVDVFEVNHHGADNSNNPTLVHALKPRVAIIGNGPRKGGEPRTFSTLKSTPEIEAIYQLHKNMRTTDKENAPADYVANAAEECKAEFIKLSVASDGKSYTVNIPGKNISRTYKSR